LTSYGRRFISSQISSPTAGFAGINCKEGSRHAPNAASILDLASFRCIRGVRSPVVTVWEI
ncbi:hypothetical protein FXO38_11330, partial [Capsicum annuum]